MILVEPEPNRNRDSSTHTAVHILNRVCTKGLVFSTPYYALTQRKPALDYLKTFGCIAYALTDPHQRDKLDTKSEKYIFVGYNNESKAYKLYNPTSSKLVISRNASFDENAKWVWPTEAQKEAATPRMTVEQLHYPLQVIPDSPPEPTIEVELPQSSTHSPSSLQPKIRSLVDIYEQTELALFTAAPATFEEATSDPKWISAMDEEWETIKQNQTWSLTELPPNKVPIGLKWLYKTKFNEKREFIKNKARLVVKGYSQIPGEDYTDTFAPVARMDTI
ncbi:hypothetical protein KSP39_PZI003778 [Platanthera zijinensis]|uniref:Reverse transcriptase Ty1/copia-type domain-containing protein n=1 Tax=Platanthera zijinensis TaxID=2320716 RepID=A0AAP0GCR4_9ASPA